MGKIEKVKLTTKEQYEDHPIRGHNLVLKTYAEIGEQPKKIVDTKRIPIPKNLRFLTKHNLWHHTDLELRELDELSKSKGEKKISNKTIDEWKSLIQKQE